MISQREAARLQSFPNSYIFSGSKTAINKQIGNAVPPILAYQIACQIAPHGVFVDLFCGAGGLSLGFKWAGWKHIISNDIDANCVKTYSENLGGAALVGDISDISLLHKIADVAIEDSTHGDGTPRILLGGPPCQGFSTAGNKRSMSDERNHLFKHYAHFLDLYRPDAFIFENVAGIKNIEKGMVFQMIIDTLSKVGYEIDIWTLNTQDYGVPQRRKRVFIVGKQVGFPVINIPPPKTQFELAPTLFDHRSDVFTVKEALDDLPRLEPGQDGSRLDYVTLPQNQYQELMRGYLSPEEYLASLSKL